MTRLLAAALVSTIFAAPALGQAAPAVRAAGATTATELLAQWTKGSSIAPERVAYDASGSGAGRRDVVEGRVDLAASEQPFSAEDLAKFNLRQFPIAFTGIVPIVNLPGVPAGALRLDGATLARIFAGRVTRWNDPAIVATNPGLTLPSLAVVPVARADSSGSTFAFTSYLSAVDADWRAARGAAATIKDFTGTRAEGTGGVVRAVQTQAGAIGYAALGSLRDGQSNPVQLRTSLGSWVQPSAEAVAAAVALGDWSRHLLDQDPPFDLTLIDQASTRAWPISAATYAVVPRRARSAAAARVVLQVAQWGFEQGAPATRAAGFVPVDDKLAFKIKLAWRVALTDERGAPLLR